MIPPQKAPSMRSLLARTLPLVGSKILDSFGARGWTNVNAERKDEGVELLWRWNRAKKAHVLKKRTIPVHKGPTRTP